MKEKVIIICHYYPPFNNTAASRPFSWFQNFHKKGYYPIIFCNNSLNNDDYYVQKEENGEVHYIKYNEHLFLKKIKSTKNNLLRKLWVILNLLFENSIRVHNSKRMFPFISDVIKRNNIEKMIVTGNPFALFGLANRLQKQHQIKWIADYRDDWSSDSVLSDTKLKKFIKIIDSYREKKYLKSCIFFTTVSDYYILKIEKIIHKKGYLNENGFNIEVELEKHSNNIYDNKLNLLFLGTVYKTQRINIILEALNIIPEEILKNIKITFLGSDSEFVEKNILYNKYIDKNIFFKSRVPLTKVKQEIATNDLMIFLPHTNNNQEILKGIPSSKLYEYIKSKKPILVCPSDNDIVERKLTETKQGIFCDNYEILAETIKKHYIHKNENELINEIEIPNEIYYKNTREFQAYEMCTLLNKL